MPATADCPAGQTLYGLSVAAKRASAVSDGARDIGGRITERRERRGWSKAELARRLEKDWRLIHKWEAEGQHPDRESLRLLAKEFGVTIEELLGVAEGQDPPFAAWPEFLETPQGKSMTRDERRMLQSIAWPRGYEPNVAAYMVALSAARTATPRAS